MKPSLAKGTRDYSASEIYKREFLINILSTHFENFGFEPLQTPSFENLSTLTGKYGEEGDRLIFKILNSADFTSKISDEIWRNKSAKQLTSLITEKALRYDLTVPFARFTAMNHGQMTFPYKRYQIQPVWRADRPQKGRYREFYQCDADVVGSTSLWQEVELVQLYFKVFSSLKLNVDIHINNRKILAGLAEYAEIENQLIDFTVALDKLDKIGKSAVCDELLSKNISEEAIRKLDFLFHNHNTQEILALLKTKFKNSSIGLEGVLELEYVLEQSLKLGIEKENLIFNITLARGLDYYTGAIFEVKAKGVEMGSIGGGGRYDNLTEVFGVKNIPGIGISFGLDRIYLVMEELNLFPTELKKSKLKYLVINYGGQQSLAAMNLVMKLREKGIPVEMYPEDSKIKKQFQYAEKKAIPSIIFYGEDEIEKGVLQVKMLDSGEQKEYLLKDFISNL